MRTIMGKVLRYARVMGYDPPRNNPYYGLAGRPAILNGVWTVGVWKLSRSGRKRRLQDRYIPDPAQRQQAEAAALALAFPYD